MVHGCTKPEEIRAQESLLAEIGQALGHPARIEILRLLENGELCSCEIGPLFHLDQSGISRHLSALRRAGLIVSRQEGVRVLNRLASSRVVDLLALADRIALEAAEGPFGRTEDRKPKLGVKRRAGLQER
jgi:ArsR family transcriptional regulator